MPARGASAESPCTRAMGQRRCSWNGCARSVPSWSSDTRSSTEAAPTLRGRSASGWQDWCAGATPAMDSDAVPGPYQSRGIRLSSQPPHSSACSERTTAAEDLRTQMGQPKVQFFRLLADLGARAVNFRLSLLYTRRPALHLRMLLAFTATG